VAGQNPPPHKIASAELMHMPYIIKHCKNGHEIHIHYGKNGKITRFTGIKCDKCIITAAQHLAETGHPGLKLIYVVK
jgi:hypothetical protein